MRGLDATLYNASYTKSAHGALPLPQRIPDPEATRELLETAASLARIAALAADQDETAAAAAAGGGDRLDEHRRFMFLFAEELAEVAQMAGRYAELDSAATDHALTWARRLAEISRGKH